MLSLKAEKREVKGKAVSGLRKEGLVPAVVYGKKDASTPITVSLLDFQKVFREAGESSVISLSGLGEDKEVLVYEVDRDPVRDTIRHVDFYAIEKGKKVEVEVPLEFVGVSPAIKDLAGNLVKVMHEITIEAFPKDLPHELTVDISSLVDFESKIHAKDISLPSGVSLITDPEEVVVLVAEPKEEPVEEETVAPDLSTIKTEGEEKRAEKEAEKAAEAAVPPKE